MSTIFAVVNQKGGVGKTTTAVNLAAFLSERGRKTLLIDLDAQANATTGVGLDASKIGANIYHFLVENMSLEEVLYPTPFDNLHAIPSGTDLAGAEVEMIGVEARETLLKRRLEVLRGYYEYIIIDCPPSLSLLTINALVAADKTIIPVQCEYYALEGLAKLVNTITIVKENYNPGLEVSGIVLTMFDSRTALNRQVVQNARQYFKDLVFDTVIPRNIRLTEAPSHGLPISLYSPSSRGAVAYKELVKEVEHRV